MTVDTGTETDVNQAHREKMARIKAVKDKIYASKTIEKGLLIVHTGTGKGKSTAAWGLAMRTLGHGLRLGVVQFVKGRRETGERFFLARFPELVDVKVMGEGFTWETQDRERDIAAARAAWDEAKRMLADPALHLVILDELNIVLRKDYLRVDDVVEGLLAKRPDLHVVVTGRNAKPELLEAADLVTEMTLVKHPFRAGVKAQLGIEIEHAALMLQGTGSNVGKSLLVTGLCRLFARRGLSVRPFKPQNMSNNAAVTPDGGEIGRAQALQARACGVPPSVHMNPVLLKPQTEVGAQLVVQGKVRGAFKARDYAAMKPGLMAPVLESYQKIARGADLVLVEGAGSPAEVNLRAGDIANMGFAEAADLAVVLVGDIDRGGVIAALVGTHALLAAPEQRRLQGYLINKFRGDASLFDDAHPVIEAHTGMRSYGVVPWFGRARLLPAEDVLGLEERQAHGMGAGRNIRIAVPRLQRLANFDDLDPLIAEPDVALRIVPPGQALPGDADLVILTGSKASIADLADFRAQGWDIDLAGHIRRGGKVLGICGGFQMLGHRLADPEGIEGPPGETTGLGLLDFETVLAGDKRLEAVRGRELLGGMPVEGYEMHLGRSDGPALACPMLDLGGRPDGAVSADGRVMGCYVHGLFAADVFRHAFLDRLRARNASGLVWEQQIEQTLDALADHLEASVDVGGLLALARDGGR